MDGEKAKELVGKLADAAMEIEIDGKELGKMNVAGLDGLTVDKAVKGIVEAGSTLLAKSKENGKAEADDKR